MKRKDTSWTLDTREEFIAECGQASEFVISHNAKNSQAYNVHQLWPGTLKVEVSLPTRSQIESVFQIFESNCEANKLISQSEPVKIFIGHGHDSQWRDLKDHLYDQHGFEVIAYEIGPRAGLSVKEVLENMLNKSSFALLLLTGEDLHADGDMHARENVIHELGLFQGKLGFTRAIALLEDGVKEFSNILGINQIRFSKGKIRETYGDILATIRREFQSET